MRNVLAVLSGSRQRHTRLIIVRPRDVLNHKFSFTFLCTCEYVTVSDGNQENIEEKIVVVLINAEELN